MWQRQVLDSGFRRNDEQKESGVPLERMLRGTHCAAATPAVNASLLAGRDRVGTAGWNGTAGPSRRPSRHRRSCASICGVFDIWGSECSSPALFSHSSTSLCASVKAPSKVSLWFRPLTKNARPKSVMSDLLPQPKDGRSARDAVMTIVEGPLSGSMKPPE